MEEMKQEAKVKSGNKSKIIIGSIILILLILALTVGVSLGLTRKKKTTETTETKRDEHKAEEYKTAAVSTDAGVCSEIGRDILKRGGTAADGAIASVICCGVFNLHSTGIAGGGFLVFYNRTEKKGYFYDFRETGFSALKSDTYNKDKNLAKIGGLGVGVPGEVRGLHLVWKKHGKLPWRDLIQPSVDLSRKGFKIGASLGGYLARSYYIAFVKKDPGLRDILMKNNKDVKKTGDYIVNEPYAQSLETIRDNPEDFYVGELAKKMIKDITNANGVMTLDDLKGYQVITDDPLSNNLGAYKMYTSKLPGGGPVLTHILNMMQGYKYTNKELSKEEKILFFHRAVESFKFSYSYRPLLGDPYKAANKTALNKALKEVVDPFFANRDRKRITDDKTHAASYYNDFFTTTQNHGTSHVSVLDADGNAAASTNTINYILGAKFRSNITGIIYNNELADFFINGSYPNKYPLPIPNAPGPGKRPLSSTCPVIITNKEGRVVMIAGASGGSKITLSTAWVIMRKLWFDMELGAAVTEGRPMHTFFPETIQNEVKNPLPSYIKEGLKKKGHQIKDVKGFAVVQAIYVDEKTGKIFAKADPRKFGKSAGY